MEKSTLSVLAFCLGASSLAHAQDMVDLQTLKVLEENRISVEDYKRVAERFPQASFRSTVTASNYDSNSIVTSGNYDSNSIVTSGNYDSGNSIITSANYDSGNSILTAGNYEAVDPELLKELIEMPSPQSNY